MPLLGSWVGGCYDPIWLLLWRLCEVLTVLDPFEEVFVWNIDGAWLLSFFVVFLLLEDDVVCLLP
jgi:hypothetical protein